MFYRDDFQLNQKLWGFYSKFRAMASPCELLIADKNPEQANNIMQLATNECRRIEQKYSRFIKGNLIGKLTIVKVKQSLLILNPLSCWSLLVNVMNSAIKNLI